jgi:dUTP pyrophosphatase
VEVEIIDNKYMEIRFKKLVPEAKTPFRTHDVDAGFDLFAVSINETPDFIEYNTGIAVEIPEGYVGLIFPRSSVTKYDLMLKNGVGVIDASYRGELMCRFHDLLQNEHVSKKRFEVGDRVAQIVFIEIPKITLVEAQELSDTERGDGGFGSTGSK